MGTTNAAFNGGANGGADLVCVDVGSPARQARAGGALGEAAEGGVPAAASPPGGGTGAIGEPGSAPGSGEGLGRRQRKLSALAKEAAEASMKEEAYKDALKRRRARGDEPDASKDELQPAACTAPEPPPPPMPPPMAPPSELRAPRYVPYVTIAPLLRSRDGASDVPRERPAAPATGGGAKPPSPPSSQLFHCPALHEHPLCAHTSTENVCDVGRMHCCHGSGTAYRCADGCDFDVCAACFDDAVPTGARVPAGEVYGGNPAAFVRKLSKEEILENEKGAEAMSALADSHNYEFLPYGTLYQLKEKL